MPFEAVRASSLSVKPVPAAPAIDALVEEFPSIQRVLYSQALGFASATSPALQACALAQLWSLLREDVPSREDARIIAARLAAALGRPEFGRTILGTDVPAAHVHRQAVEQARIMLSQTPERPLTSWAPGLSTIARRVVDRLREEKMPWLAIGPSAALAVLYGPLESHFTLTVLHPAALQARFGSSLPRTCVLAEPDLDPSGTSQLLNAYAALPFTSMLCVSGSASLPPVPGFSAASEEVGVPLGTPLFLGHALYVQSAKFSPETPVANGTVTVTLHVWKRSG